MAGVERPTATGLGYSPLDGLNETGAVVPGGMSIVYVVAATGEIRKPGATAIARRVVVCATEIGLA